MCFPAEGHLNRARMYGFHAAVNQQLARVPDRWELSLSLLALLNQPHLHPLPDYLFTQPGATCNSHAFSQLWPACGSRARHRDKSPA